MISAGQQREDVEGFEADVGKVRIYKYHNLRKLCGPKLVIGRRRKAQGDRHGIKKEE